MNWTNWAPDRPRNPDNACVVAAFNATINTTSYNATSSTAPAWQWSNEHCINTTRIYICRKMGA